jgi:hypothetical protein
MSSSRACSSFHQNGEALTGDARQKIAKAAEKVYAYIRLLSSLIPVSPTSRLLPPPILVQRRSPTMLARRSPSAYGRPGLRGVGNDAAGSEASTLKISISSCPSVWHGCNSPKRKERRALSHFQWKHGTTLDASVLLLGERHAKSGGSHELHLYDHGRAIFVCHRNLQSAGNASWPLHCRASSFDALYCPASAEAAPHYRKYRAR